MARADALRYLGLDRREALWAVKGLPAGTKSAAPLPLFAAARAEELGTAPAVTLPAMRLSEHVVDDYASLRFSLKAHPLSFLRDGLAAEGIVEAKRLIELPNGKPVKVAGLVLVRQSPGTAKGVIFATLEDETGVVNVIVWPDVFARQRKVLLGARLLGVEGPLQREGLVIHVIAKRLVDLSPRLKQLSAPGFDHGARELGEPLVPPHARADRVTRPGGPDPREAGDARALYPSRNFR